MDEWEENGATNQWWNGGSSSFLPHEVTEACHAYLVSGFTVTVVLAQFEMTMLFSHPLIDFSISQITGTVG